MAFFKKNKNKNKDTVENEAVKKQDALRDDISKAYDEIMSNGISSENREDAEKTAPQVQGNFENELLKMKINEFKEKKTQESIIEVLKLLPKKKFLLPGASNVEQPFEKVGDELKLKEGAILTPALLTSKDKKMFLPIFTDEKAMVQKSPSGVNLKFSFEQCLNIIYDEKNPVESIVINPFTENMVLGIELIKSVFQPVQKNVKD